MHHFNNFLRVDAVVSEILLSLIFGTRFRTGRPKLGYSAHLINGGLVIETVSKGRKLQTHKVEFVFQSYKWYMITVSYVHHRVRNSQLSVSVNGRCLLAAEVILPTTDDVRS